MKRQRVPPWRTTVGTEEGVLVPYQRSANMEELDAEVQARVASLWSTVLYLTMLSLDERTWASGVFEASAVYTAKR